MHDFSKVTVGELCEGLKKGGLVTVPKHKSLQGCAEWMATYNISSLLVFDGEEFVGIVTERDFTRRGIAHRVGYDEPVEKIMTPADDIVTITMDVTLNEAAEIMEENHVRHLPICDESGKPIAMLSRTDLHFNAQNILDFVQFLKEEPFHEMNEFRT